MLFRLKNCKNIIEGQVSVEEGKLNIRYGSNGTGKTTISMAIQSLVSTELKEKLIPYSNPDLAPEITASPIMPTSIRVFDEGYISKFLFQETYVLETGRVYEVLIKNEQLEVQREQLLNLFTTLIEYVKSEEIQNFLTKINSVSKDLQLNENDTFKGTSKAYKALKDGNKYIRENIPELLNNYVELLTGDNNVKWIDWFSKGHEYSIDCPYCRAVLSENFSEIKESISNSYKKADVQNATGFLNSLDNNFNFLDEENINIVINKFVDNSALNADDHELVNIIKKLYRIKDLLETIQGLSVYDLLNEVYVDRMFENFIVAKADLNFIGDENLIFRLESIENAINDIISSRTDYLRDKGIFNTLLHRRVNDSQNHINDFMKTAGIPYQVEIIDTTTSNPKIILKHISQNLVNNILDGLSFGERNAFALMMFLMDVSSDYSDLIILDDPISSFDENKKYAILHALFLNGNDFSLKNKNVLMLTHDFAPIIDLIKTKSYPYIEAKYLICKNGVLSEHDITQCEIKSVIQVARDTFIDNTKSIISRLVNYRRYLELSNNFNNLKYDMVSSILKLKERAQMKNPRGEFMDFTDDEMRNIEQEIRLVFSDFDYGSMLLDINTKEQLITAYDTATSFEKVNIIRVLKFCVNEGIGESVLAKFIDESYHIENTYTFQLNPTAYNCVPEYIINACNEYVNRHR